MFVSGVNKIKFSVFLNGESVYIENNPDNVLFIKLYNKVETLFLLTSIQYSYLSSSIVKQVAAENGDISKFVPDFVVNKLKEKYNN